MRINKKILAAVLAVVVCVSMTPAIAFTQGAKADTNVAEVNGTEYATLQAAIDVVPDNTQTTITLLAKCNTYGGTRLPKGQCESGVEISKDKNIVLDLRGNTITGGTSDNNTNLDNNNYVLLTPVIDNSGTLTIKDSQGGGIVTSYEGDRYVGVNNYSPQQTTIMNEANGTMTLSGGTYKSDRAGYVVQNKGTMTINSGVTAEYVGNHDKHSSTIINGYRDFEYTTAPSGQVCRMTINGGTFSGYHSVVKNGDYYSDLTINGGSFTALSGDPSNGGEVIRNCGTCTAAINGGTFTGITTQNTTDFVLAKDAPTDKDYVITGGTFSADPTKYVASGYVVSQSGSSYIVSAYVAPKTDTTTTTGSDGTVESTTTTTPDVAASENGNVTATVDNTEGDKIVKNVKDAEAAAAKDGKTIETNVIVSSAGSSDAGQVSVSLPASTISGLANETNATVTLKTSIGNVTLDQKALDAIAEKSGDTGTVTLIIVNVDKGTLPSSVQSSLGSNAKVIDLKLVTSNRTVSDFNGGTATVETQVPDGIAAKDAACVFLDDNNIAYNVGGKVVTVNGKNMYRFTTGHNSHYAIVSKASASSLTKGYAPTGVKAKVTGNKSIKVTWKKFSGATSYRVYKATKKTGKYTYVGKTTGTSLTAKGLKAKTKYYFKVKAMSGENYKTSKIVSAKTPSANGFLSFTLTNVSGNKVKVHWKAVKGAVKYQIAYDSPGNKTLKTRWTGTNSKNTYTSINRVKGQTYNYKMRYYKIKNGKKVYSDWTEVQSVTVDQK